jgi:hypothetical protein
MLSRLLGATCQTEVQDLHHTVVGDEDVAGLDVADALIRR